MNKQSLGKVTAFASFSFAVFCLLWTLLTFLLLPVEASESDYSLLVLDPQWTAVALCGLLASVFGLFALGGILIDAYDRAGYGLLIGIILFVLGLLLEFAGLTWDVFIWPVICANNQYVSFVTDGVLISNIRFNVFLILMLTLLISGTFLTAFSLLKSRLYGKWVPWMLIAGIVFYALGHLFTMYVSMAGLCLYCGAFVLIGIKLLKPQV